MEDEEYDEQDEEESEGLILSIGKDGKAELHKPEDWVEIKKEEMNLIQGFIKENKKLFEEYIKKHKK